MSRIARKELALAGLLAAALAACGEPTPVGRGSGAGTTGFVGTASCAGCHAAEHAAWQGSDHDRAMQEARSDTVLGDFGDVTFRHRGESTRFFREGDAYRVETRGPDGVVAVFPVEYTFGVAPLQQYLVALPGGRLQAFTVAWDTRLAAQGGQRWFSLHPDEDVPPGDVLHWSGPANRWNAMCAHCHSTGMRKDYDLEADRYASTWSEIDVACEACHGPGARHVAWAKAGAEGDSNGLRILADGPPARWVMDEARGIARRVPPRESHAEIETCAPCHSRRSLLSEDPVAEVFLDAHLPALLQEGLYFHDGQIRDEVYVWGSFVQSRMFAAGVTCSDCHEPHSLALRGTTETVCEQCHAPARFASQDHHHHSPGSEGARCVSCHMPARTYMEIDDRRDHGFRVPRPDLSGRLGTPNACTGCHEDRNAAWATAAVRAWRGGDAPLPRHFGEVLGAARDGVAGSDADLEALVRDAGQPAIARATALQLLAARRGPAASDTIALVSRDPDPLLRATAARANEFLPPEARPALATPLLRDPVRAVRIEAAGVLAGAPMGTAEDRRALERGLDEYRAAQNAAADRPQAHVNLALLHLSEGEPELAEAAYRRALSVGDYFVPAYVNLADLYRAQDRDEEALPLLLRARELAPESPEVRQALGLLLVRAQRLDEALVELEAAARRAPERARFAYVHGVALHSTGRTDAALAVWAGALRRHPYDPELLVALATTYRDAGQPGRALAHVRTLERAHPGEAAVARLRAEIEAACALAGDCPPGP